MPGDPDTQHLLLEHLSSGTRCVIHIPQEPQARDAGPGLEQLADILLLQIKPEKGPQGRDAKQIAERTDLDRQQWVPAATGERLRQKNVPIKYQFIITTYTGPPSPFHKNNNKQFLHYFPISHPAQSKRHRQDQKVLATDRKPDSSPASCGLLREPAEPLSVPAPINEPFMC